MPQVVRHHRAEQGWRIEVDNQAAAHQVVHDVSAGSPLLSRQHNRLAFCFMQSSQNSFTFLLHIRLACEIGRALDGRASLLAP